MQKLTPSPRQQAILDALSLPHHLLVQACAGSGKTSTLALICEQIPPTLRSVALCFNKSIALEFQRRLPRHVEACTLHSLGFAACRRAVKGVRVDDRKLKHVLDALPALQQIKEEDARIIKSDLDAMCGLVMDMHLDPTSETEILEAIDVTGRTVESFATAFPFLADVVQTMDSWTDTICFAEMLRHPLIHGYNFYPFDVVLVDESQDLNAVQHALLARIVKPGGKLIAVGDKHQSIYGFRGADIKSMQRLKTEWDMLEFPLDVSYRCPVAVVEEAQKIIGIGTINAHPHAPQGSVERRPLKQMQTTEEQLKAGDMVLCRINAPLVPLAFRLLRQDKRVLLRGRDLGVGLVALIKKFKAESVNDLIKKTHKWCSVQMDKARAAQKSEQAIQAIEDKAETLICFAEECATVAEVLVKIENLFSDQAPHNVVLLSTVHKAKGLEAQTVVLINPDLLPAPWAKTDTEKEQEKNIAYVAVTRAMRCLIFQDSPKHRGKRKNQEDDSAQEQANEVQAEAQAEAQDAPKATKKPRGSSKKKAA